MTKPFKLTLTGTHSEDERGVAAIAKRVSSFVAELFDMGVRLEPGFVAEYDVPEVKGETKTEAAVEPAVVGLAPEPAALLEGSATVPEHPPAPPKKAPARKRPAANRKK